MLMSCGISVVVHTYDICIYFMSNRIILQTHRTSSHHLIPFHHLIISYHFIISLHLSPPFILPSPTIFTLEQYQKSSQALVDQHTGMSVLTTTSTTTTTTTTTTITHGQGLGGSLNAISEEDKTILNVQVICFLIHDLMHFVMHPFTCPLIHPLSYSLS